MTKPYETIPEAALVAVTGGMKWQNLCESLNVEDRRPGAPPLWKQRQLTIERNRARGCAPR